VTAAEVARELERLSLALAHAIDASELEAAEALLAARGHLLDAAPTPTPVDRPAIAAIAAVVVESERRARTALAAAIERTRAALTDVRVGAIAVRAYGGAALAPGYVDRHD
jgi:hypothetical protein